MSVPSFDKHPVPEINRNDQRHSAMEPREVIDMTYDAQTIGRIKNASAGGMHLPLTEGWSEDDDRAEMTPDVEGDK